MRLNSPRQPRIVAPTCAKPRSLPPIHPPPVKLASAAEHTAELPIESYFRELSFGVDPATVPVIANAFQEEAALSNSALELDEGDFIELPSPEPPEVEDLGATTQLAVAVDPRTARFVVTAGVVPGELVLRALRPGEPPPPDAPIATLVPSCGFDAYRIGGQLNNRR